MLFRKMLIKSLFARLRKSVRYVLQSRPLQRISVDIQLGSVAFVVPQCARYVDKLYRQTFGQARKVNRRAARSEEPLRKTIDEMMSIAV